MRVLAACSLGGSGHLQPLVPFLSAARRRGDEVLVVGPPGIAPLVDASGFAFSAGGEPSEEQIAPIRERLPVASPAEASRLGNLELFARLAADAMLPHVDALCARWRPDVVLRDPCEYASAVVAHTRGIPTAQIAISLAEAEDGSIAAAAPALEARRPSLVHELMTDPYLTRFPSSLDPSPFTDTVRFHEPTRTARPLPDWWDGARGPLVYVTFGTVLGHMTLAAEVFRTAIDAVAELDARVLLTVGHRFDASELGLLPKRVHAEAWVDQHDVLTQADLVVCHGGSGTVFGALGAGVPLVVVPVFADQFENARRVAAVGAGLVVDTEPDAANECRRPIGRADAPCITDAIQAVLDDTGFAAHAGAIADEMASTSTVEEVLAGLV
jgi:UDP:flavonoid glycosyltransferase YjiC (YdhE family)